MQNHRPKRGIHKFLVFNKLAEKYKAKIATEALKSVSWKAGGGNI